MVKNREIAVVGGSMMPSFWAGCRVEVEPIACDRVRVGDIVGYIGSLGTLEAHRVVAIDCDKERKFAVTRGDAQTDCEMTPFNTITFRVKSVSWKGLKYEVDGCAGRLLTKLALKGGCIGPVVARAMDKVFKKYAVIRQRIAE